MRNHDQKTRDMARSILPSTARHVSRNRKRGSARRARARNHARLGRLMDHLDDLDNFEEDLGRYDLDDVGWDGMVEDRRGADKVAPLIRWAEARIARNPSLRDGDYWVRRNHFAGLLGDTVIGRHALQHLDHLFGEENPFWGGYWIDWEERRERERTEARLAHEARSRMLDDVLANADARGLNTRVRALTPPVEEHWILDAHGTRVRDGQSGCEPWVYDGDRDRWLTAGGRDVQEAMAIAFHALAEIHAEMFGYDA